MKLLVIFFLVISFQSQATNVTPDHIEKIIKQMNENNSKLMDRLSGIQKRGHFVNFEVVLDSSGQNNYSDESAKAFCKEKANKAPITMEGTFIHWSTLYNGGFALPSHRDDAAHTLVAQVVCYFKISK